MTAYDLEPPFDPETDRPPVLDPDIPPNSRGAEQALLGTLMVNPDMAPLAATLIDRDDIYRPEHIAIWDSIHAVTATGALPEPALVLDHLTRVKELNKVGGAPYLFELVQAGRFGQLDEYARIVRDTSRLRSAQEATSKVRSAIQSARPENVTDAIEAAVTVMDQELVRFGASTNQRIRHHVETIDELLHGEDDDTYDWVIPGLLERQERVIITAEEGAGKSTLLRQIAVQAAAGIHPFTLEAITPITVLHIDVENTRRQSRRRYRPLRFQAGHQLESDRLRIELRTAGLDLTTETDRDWLLDTCRYVQPDLLLIGPIYKLANGDPTEEKSAKPVAMALDLVRDQIDCAIVLEAHAAKATGNGNARKRPHEPYGWSGWMRWPEVGLWLDRDGTLSPWRGAREERSWPFTLQRGGIWPWAAVLSDVDKNWNTIRRARLDHGEYLSIRELVKQTGITKAQIERAIGPAMPYKNQWLSLNGTPSQRSIEDEL
ncbi:AAA family ATPase [Nocardioides lacusdianchii]|uniref:AAA family ATPase n=1 Tax=Nocardioides lacusdianchii TaxID=2783664 RepID=UPI001CCDB5EA|nr:AAA family ATPase [Nocardioides lacusdianchii]